MKKPDPTAPPKPRTMKPRLPDAARTLEPGQWLDVPDAETAICVRAHGRGKGWKMVQRKDSVAIRVWRLK